MNSIFSRFAALLNPNFCTTSDKNVPLEGVKCLIEPDLSLQVTTPFVQPPPTTTMFVSIFPTNFVNQCGGSCVGITKWNDEYPNRTHPCERMKSGRPRRKRGAIGITVCKCTCVYGLTVWRGAMIRLGEMSN